MTGDHLIGRTLDGRYRIESLIARGGMATVYAASDLRLRRTVAVKVMHASLAEDPDFVHRFEREAHAAAQLANPHVVAVHDQGRDAATGAIYLVMEYVVGRTVRETLASRGRLTGIQALAVLDPVLQALAAAHDAGFVHRDVKPENVIIGDDGRIKVTDFGLARAIVASPLSAATQGVLIGTVAYLSPEQVERGYADARSDVYGAGVLLYEMLTGEVPHSGETPLAVAYQHVHADVPPPSQLVADLASVLDDVVMRATRRDPEQRFTDARDFLLAVRTARAQIDPQYTTTLPPVEAQAAPAAPSAPVAAAAAAPVTPTANVTTPPAPKQPRIRRAPRERNGRRRGLFAGIAGLAVIIAALGWWLTAGTHSTVPDVIGMPVAAATDALTNASLAAETRPAWNATVPEGSVVDAEPAPGTTVRHDTRVQLVVSKGPERYNVPDITGDSVSSARTALTRVKLVVGATSYAYSDSVPRGRILSSNPAAGRVARPGDKVDVVVSKGPAPIAVPSVAGRSSSSAQSALQAAGFSTSTSSVYDDRVPAGSVIRSQPNAGVLLQRGSTVQLIVSKGPAPVKVPDVFRLSESKAVSLLKAAGLKVRVTKASGRLLNLVKSQSPAAGTVVPHGSTVTITIV